MAFFNTNLPISQAIPRQRQFSGNWWSRTKMSLSGSKTDGSSNLWGDIVGKGLSPVLGALSQIYLGNYALGDKVGDLANMGLNKASSNLLEGTAGQQVSQDNAASEQRTRRIISAIGTTAASIYGAAQKGKQGGGGDEDQVGSDEENAILDKALKGISKKSIGDYLSDNDATFDLSSLNALGNLPVSQKKEKNDLFNPSALDPNSALSKFFAMQQENFGLNGIVNQYNQAPKSAGQDLNINQNSSTIGIIGDGIRALDDKKKKPSFNFESSLPYSSPDGFAQGGKPSPKPLIKMAPKKTFYSLEGIKKKTPSHLA